jgi:DNA repair protein RadC
MGSLNSTHRRDSAYSQAGRAANLGSGIRSNPHRLVVCHDTAVVDGDFTASFARGKIGPGFELADSLAFPLQSCEATISTMPIIGEPVTGTLQIARYLLRLAGQNAEEFVHAFFLDRTNRLTWSETVARGNSHTVAFDYRTIVSTALRLDAHGIIIGHNHPSGSATPSKMDIAATRNLKGVCEPLGVKIIDHLIVARQSCFSFLAENLL